MTGKPEETGAPQHIWLRYATEFSTGGRTYTIEMGIPVPLGATAEIRERLIHEAETGMDQLATHVEKRIAQVVQRAQPARSTPQAEPKSTAAPPSPPPASKPSAKPASTPAPVTAPPAALADVPTQPEEAVEAVPAQAKEIQVPPTHPQIGGTMPLSLGMIGDASGNFSRPQFIQFIREALGLNPRQAMDLLKVRSLDGLNLREALKQLQRLTQQEITAPADATGQTAPAQVQPAPEAQPKPSTTSPAKPEERPTKSAPPAPPPASPAIPAAAAPPAPVKSPPVDVERGVVREIRPVVFDEEIELGEEDVYEREDDDEDMSGLTPQQRVTAKNCLNKLREARGPNTASPSRLTALQNVVNSQVEEEQLLHLIEGVWGRPSLKRLTEDPVEPLISWAKEDFFVEEVDGVMALIQEEQYARSDG